MQFCLVAFLLYVPSGVPQALFYSILSLSIKQLLTINQIDILQAIPISPSPHILPTQSMA